MRVVKTMCDREDCKREGANKLHLFQTRKSDGAGSMEDWHYTFDLCHEDEHTLLERILDLRGFRFDGVMREDVLKILKDMKVQHRIE